MSAGDLLRILMIVIGLLLLCLTVISLAKKHLTESFCIFWGFVSVLFIIAGIVLRPVIWDRYISWSGSMILFVLAFCLLIGGMFFSMRISKLLRQSTELAIQVSLLNQENEMLLAELTKQKENEDRKNEEKDLICY